MPEQQEASEPNLKGAKCPRPAQELEAQEKESAAGEEPLAGARRAKKPLSKPPRDTSSGKEIKAYSSLRAKGVSDQAIIRWEKIISRSGLTPGAVQSELTKTGNLSRAAEKTEARIEKAQQSLEKIQAKSDELRKKYSSAWDSVMRYQLLREEGVDGAVLQRWEKLIAGNGLVPEKVEDELIRLRTLEESRKEREGRVAELDAKEAAARERARALEGELAKLEAQRGEVQNSIDAVARSVQSMASEATGTMTKVRDEAGEDLRKVSEGAQAELASAAAALDGFKAKIEEAYASAVRTGETIGKYEALGPLLRFVEFGEGKPGEVVPLMSLLARTLAKWAKDGDPVLSAKARDLEVYLDEKLRMG